VGIDDKSTEFHLFLLILVFIHCHTVIYLSELKFGEYNDNCNMIK
jgi:hypothetical protein